MHCWRPFIVAFALLSLLLTPPAMGGTTGPPPAIGGITGHLLDPNGAPLPSATSPWSWLVLVRLDPTSSTTVAYTDCYGTGQGCVDAAGFFSFGQPFPPGTYVLSMNAQGYLSGHVNFLYDGVSQYLGLLFLTRSPVSVVIDNQTPTLPQSGGIIKIDYFVTSTGGKALAFESRVAVQSPGVTNPYLSFELRRHRGAVGPDKPRADFRTAVNVPAGIPDGSWICVFVEVTPIGKPFEVLDEWGRCSYKGSLLPPSPPPIPPPPPPPVRRWQLLQMAPVSE